MADVAAGTPGAKPPVTRRAVGFYEGVMAELRRVVWPEWKQVQSATIAIIVFVLVLGLVISALDGVLQAILVKALPALFAR